MALRAKPYLQEVAVRRETVPDDAVYPFNIPAVRERLASA